MFSTSSLKTFGLIITIRASRNIEKRILFLFQYTRFCKQAVNPIQLITINLWERWYIT